MDITFKVQFETQTQWGEEVFVCGSDESLGSWDPAKAFKLLYQPGSWSSVVHFANPNAVVQYKYLVKNTHDPNVPVKWEERENRVVSLKGRFKHQPMVVEEVWNQADRRVVPLNQQPGHNETHHDRQHQHTSKSKAERKARKDKRRALKKEREAREARQSQLAAKSSSTPSTSTTTEPAAPVEIPTWMQRTHMLLGNEQLSRLINCNVLVVGLGGVGAFAAEMVARAGVGKMTIVDNDTVDITNCNRQLGALHSTVGKVKAEVLAARLRDINPKLDLTVLPIYIADGKAQDLLEKNKFDYAMDCIDTLSSKCWFIRCCREAGVPVASSMGAGGKVDPSKIKSGDISDVTVCRFSQAVRKRLHKWGIHEGIPVVYSEESIDPSKLVLTPNTIKKSTIGTISYMPAIFGCTLASIVIRDLFTGKQ